MKNMWPENFSSIDIIPAKDIVDAQCEYLKKMTNDIVYANSYKLTHIPSPRAFDDPHKSNQFVYRMEIRGKLLDDYYFRLISYSHDITLYPCIVSIEESVADDIGLSYVHTVVNETEFQDLFSKILHSERLKMIVGSIIKLSARQ